ncbi:MAG: hypothetical protein AB7G44_03740 [Bacteroidia bacterium]
MTQLLLISTIFTLTVLTSCGQTDKQPTNETGRQKTAGPTPTIEPILVDYKSDTYKISIGDNYKTSDKIIDWHWAAMDDEDGKIDSTGKDAFLYLGEPLINYNDGEWLPSLHITTDRNIITSFTCSVLFDLQDNPTAIDNFLRLLSNDIKQLKNDDIVKSLQTKGYYEVINTDHVVTFKLTQGKKYENDRFAYTITTR